ncbi:MAG: PAS domain-containing protein [Ginsengibacter sp.]
MKNNHAFLSGGGEMGKLIREKDWISTPLGDPVQWPQVLRTIVSMMLDNPFGMYIAWGKEYTQIYNDGFRPILGESKHPYALGNSSTETFGEIWHITGPMFEGVMNGVPVASQDFMVPLNRNGFIENCYFDFAYSPIRKDNGEVGGVLVTVIETTEKKKAVDDLKESEEQLQFAMEAADLASFDYAPITNKFSSNAKLKEWFGLSSMELIDLTDAINLVQKDERQKVSDAILQSLNYSSGGIFDFEYCVINPITNKKTIVHAKGKTWFNEDQVPYRMSGILEEVSDRTITQRKITQSEQRFRSLVESAPFPIAVYAGKEMEVVLANQSMIKAWGK